MMDARTDERAPRAARPKAERISASGERALGLVPDLIVMLAKDLRFLVREYQTLDVNTKGGREAGKKIERLFGKIDGLVNVRLDAVGYAGIIGRDRLSPQAQDILDRAPASIRQLASLFRTLAKEYQAQRPDTAFGQSVRDRIKKNVERLGYLPGNYSGVY
jgi:hypothetical protein